MKKSVVSSFLTMIALSAGLSASPFISHALAASAEAPGDPLVITAAPLIDKIECKKDEKKLKIDPRALADDTGLNGGPRWHADQDRSYGLSCGFVSHRFYDEKGNFVDRPVRICN